MSKHFLAPVHHTSDLGDKLIYFLKVYRDKHEITGKEYGNSKRLSGDVRYVFH
jgi:hypothetical protein